MRNVFRASGAAMVGSPHWFGLVYRARNASTVERLLESLEGRAWDIHLWALDEPVASLAELTRGVGPGGKFELLQRLADTSPPEADRWMVLSDDDFVFRRGSLPELGVLARVYGFDLAQPAHRRAVNMSHRITLAQRGVLARLTHFVEIGPLLLMSPRAQRLLLPFPAARIGWGIDALWGRASLNGEIRLGIVDAVTIDHLSPIGVGYDRSVAHAEFEHFLGQAGLGSLHEVQTTISSWRRYRHRPDDWGSTLP